MTWLPFEIPMPSISLTITIGDIIIIFLLYVLIKKLRIPAKELLKEMKKEAAKLVMMAHATNPISAIGYIIGETLLELVKQGKISKEEAKQILRDKLKKLLSKKK